MTTYLPHTRETVPMLPGTPDHSNPERYWICPYCSTRSLWSARQCLDCQGIRAYVDHSAPFLCITCHNTFAHLDDVIRCYQVHRGTYIGKEEHHA